MELGLRGRKALITGASRGIGRACAAVLAEEGCDVVLVSRTTADLEAAKAKITAQHNVAVRCFPLDLSDSKSVHTGRGMPRDRSADQQCGRHPARQHRRHRRGGLARCLGI
jgi:short-subunit dehydrogenase